MTTLKVRRIGNSLGVILPSGALERLDVKEGDELHLVPTSRPGEWVLRANAPAFAETMRVFDRGRKKFRNALKILADR